MKLIDIALLCPISHMISRIFCHQSKCSAARPSPCFDIPHIVACVCSPLCQNEVTNSKVSVTNGHTFEYESYKLFFCSCLESELQRISLSVLPTIRKLLWFTVARLLAESGLTNRNFSGQRVLEYILPSQKRPNFAGLWGWQQFEPVCTDVGICWEGGATIPNGVWKSVSSNWEKSGGKIEITESNQSSYRLLHKSLWPQDCQYICQCLKVIFLNQIAHKFLSYCTYHFRPQGCGRGGRRFSCD